MLAQVPACDSEYMNTLYCYPTGHWRPGCWHYDLIPHSVTLSRYWANQHLPYPSTDSCLFEFYILTTSKVISWWEPICDSAPSWWLYSAAPLENQAASTLTWYSTQSQYPDTELTSACPILLMPSYKNEFYKSLIWLNQDSNPWAPMHRSPKARLGSDKCQFCKSFVWPGWFSSSRPFGGGELTQLGRAWGRWPWGQDYEPKSLL